MTGIIRVRVIDVTLIIEWPRQIGSAGVASPGTPSVVRACMRGDGRQVYVPATRAWPLRTGYCESLFRGKRRVGRKWPLFWRFAPTHSLSPLSLSFSLRLRYYSPAFLLFHLRGKTLVAPGSGMIYRFLKTRGERFGRF